MLTIGRENLFLTALTAANRRILNLVSISIIQKLDKLNEVIFQSQNMTGFYSELFKRLSVVQILRKLEVQNFNNPPKRNIINVDLFK